jgi:hypothetical protein
MRTKVPHKLMTRALIGGLALAAAGVPAVAQARPVAYPPTPPAPASHTVAAPSSPFARDDAGIGAVAAAVLLGTGAAAVAARRRNADRPVVG